ncbi:MAG: hypothetical protein BHW65_01505 [Verrucomicrobia bacterium CAG:312_58_20]|nr:MAG: hypothetical protein BHW65_01505 [Verrucomicrobia bacterium CAG:312_58_20]
MRAAIVRNASLAVFLRFKIAFAEFSIFSARLRGRFFLFFMRRLRACRAARKKTAPPASRGKRVRRISPRRRGIGCCPRR